jgi:hypothetical protein
MARVRGGWIALLVGGVAAGATAWVFSGRVARNPLPGGDYEVRLAPDWEVTGADAAAMREDAWRRAQVWREPAVPIEQADLSGAAAEAPPLDTSAVVCKFLPRPHSGTTLKFDCILPGGEVIKVKYARTGESEAELAATRLLTALGFGADHMYLVPRLRCHGCPRNPFRTYQFLELLRLDAAYTRQLDYDAYVDFEWVSAERRLDAPAINGPQVRGWAFHELDKIDPARGGASREQVDALRLLAVFLHHWDNKAENQRLVCLAAPSERNGPCPEPFALLQDVGSTFGPHKVSFASWSERPVWTDPGTCELTMKDMPWGGATFTNIRITEGGRRFLAERLGRLSEPQIRGLFTGARFGKFHRLFGSGADVSAWVRAFQHKVREIRDRPPCPDLTSSVGPFPSPPSRPSA